MSRLACHDQSTRHQARQERPAGRYSRSKSHSTSKTGYCKVSIIFIYIYLRDYISSSRVKDLWRNSILMRSTTSNCGARKQLESFFITGFMTSYYTSIPSLHSSHDNSRFPILVCILCHCSNESRDKYGTNNTTSVFVCHTYRRFPIGHARTDWSRAMGKNEQHTCTTQKTRSFDYLGEYQRACGKM